MSPNRKLDGGGSVSSNTINLLQQNRNGNETIPGETKKVLLKVFNFKYRSVNVLFHIKCVGMYSNQRKFGKVLKRLQRSIKLQNSKIFSICDIFIIFSNGTEL